MTKPPAFPHFPAKTITISVMVRVAGPCMGMAMASVAQQIFSEAAYQFFVNNSHGALWNVKFLQFEFHPMGLLWLCSACEAC